jgi:HlyD family secretion protein
VVESFMSAPATSPPASTAASAPWEAKRKQSKSGRVRKIIAWLIGGGLVGSIIYGLIPKPIETEMGVVTLGPLTVQVVEEGKTRVRNRYSVAASVTGQMRRVLLKAGDEVKAGETILTTIEPSLAPLLDGRARAQTEARVQGAAAALDKAKEALEMAQTAAQFAESNWGRIKSGEKGSISLTERESAERDAELRSREVRASSFAIKVAEFELAQAKASLLQFDAPGAAGTVVEVKSPVSGRVLKVFQESAMVVTAGTLLVEVGDPTDLEIEAEMLSRDAVVIKPGALVQVEQWGGEAPLQARVRRVEPAAFTKVSALGVEEQRVIVLSDLVNPPESAKALGDRFRVEVRVAIWQGDAVLQAPSGALFREGQDWMAFLFDQGKARKIKLTASHSNGRSTEITSGLVAGQMLLLHPPDTVQDGTAVSLRAK